MRKEITNPEENANEEEVSLKYDGKAHVFKGAVLGFFIGLAIIVPGVSGAAVAIIFGLYEKLLYAMGNLLRKFKKCFVFLLPVIIGGVIGIAGGFFGVRKLMNVIPFAVVALFAGLMTGALPVITDKIKDKERTPFRLTLIALGVIIPVGLSLFSVFFDSYDSSLENLQIYHYVLFVALGYAVAITQIVPGLSATALLMMFGLFTPLMNSINLELFTNLSLMMVFVCLAVGFIAGLLTFSSAMSKLLARYENTAYFFITGLSIGAAITMFFNPEIYEVYVSWAADTVAWQEIILGAVLFAAGFFASRKLVAFEKGKGN
ncbi:MAG: DUF368 domain-containing protein [Candidatus Borkfalkiaceae bacterium]|nr:DUF368 domain-containing protein [Christensenellaceae bacterium]